MHLSDFLTPLEYNPGEQTLVAVDPATRFVIMATQNGPERMDSSFRKVAVPTFDWSAKGVDEDDEIARVLVEASSMNPLKIPTPAALNETFWAGQRGVQAMLCNANLLGKFPIPDGPEVLTSDHVAANQLILIGSGAGFYVRQGQRRGVVSNRSAALLQVQFYVV